MNTENVCPTCGNTGLVSRLDIFEPYVTVFEPCKNGCKIPPPEYANSYRYDDVLTWPDWLRPSGVSLCHPTAKTSDGLTVLVDNQR